MSEFLLSKERCDTLSDVFYRMFFGKHFTGGECRPAAKGLCDLVEELIEGSLYSGLAEASSATVIWEGESEFRILLQTYDGEPNIEEQTEVVKQYATILMQAAGMVPEEKRGLSQCVVFTTSCVIDPEDTPPTTPQTDE